VPLIIKGEWEVDGRTMEALDEGAELWFANKQMEQGNVCACACACAFACVYVCALFFGHMYTHTYIHTYIHSCIHIHTHTHIYIYTCTYCGFRDRNKQMQQGIGVLEH
jgi:hypothetical protein